jgi:ATP-binding cassette subfamily B protein
MPQKVFRFSEFINNIRTALGYSFRIAKWETVGNFTLSTIYAVLPYGTAFLLGTLVNRLTVMVNAPTQIGVGILGLFLSYAMVSSLPNLISGINLFITKLWRFKYQAEMEVEILRKRAQMDIAHYEDPKFQDLLQRAFQRSHWPLLELADIQFDIFRGLVALIAGSVLSAAFSWKIYIVIIICSIPKFVTEYKYGYNIWSIWMKDSPEQRRFVDLRRYFMSRTNVTETKLYQSVEYLLSWLKNILIDFNNKQIDAEKKKLLRVVLSEILAFGGFVFGAFFILQDVLSGAIMIGSMVFLLSTLSNVQHSFGDLLYNIARQNERHLIVKDILEFMNTKPFVDIPKKPKKLKLKSPPEIEFENVSFKYPNSDKWSLKNLNFIFKPGQKIGLVGNNGAGKTTLVKLICRIYDPTKGRILINGINLKDLDFNEWWSYLGVMFQDFSNYDFVTKEAIAMGRPEKTLSIKEVIRAAKISESHSFIEEWKRKYDEPIGVEFDGVEPSKGQRQKLAISRVIYRNPYVMILDEPTASVDAESEAKIFDSLDSLPNSMTAILISHDFSTIRECDEIFVFDHGELAESGSHDDLMKNNTLYSELFKLQAKRFV